MRPRAAGEVLASTKDWEEFLGRPLRKEPRRVVARAESDSMWYYCKSKETSATKTTTTPAITLDLPPPFVVGCCTSLLPFCSALYTRTYPISKYALLYCDVPLLIT